MAYGSDRYGLSWWGIGVGYSTYDISAGGFIADLKSEAINAGGYIAEAQSTYISASANIAERKSPNTIYASAKVAELKTPHSIDADGYISELKGPAAINASATVAEKLAEAINAGGYIAEAKWAEIYASALIWGAGEWSIYAAGKVAELKTPHSINASAKVAQVRQNYVNASAKVALKRENIINASGLIQGNVILSINGYANIAEPQSGSINASANVAQRQIKTIYASGTVANLNSLGLNVGGYLANLLTKVIQASANIGDYAGPTSINASATIAQKSTHAINAASSVADRLSKSINASTNISQPILTSINASGAVALPSGSYYINASGLIIASPYYYLNGVDVTNIMLEGLKPKGPERKLSKQYFPSQERLLITEDGFDAKEFSFESYFQNQADAFSYANVIMSAAGDMKFYPGDSLWFHKVKYINVERVKRRGAYYFVMNTTVTMEKPWLYLDLATTWSPGSIALPRVSSDIINNGHYDTPLELLKITGHYLNGYPLGITYAVMDGVNQISSLSLADKLLSEEIIELDEDGILSSTYADDFSSSTRWGHDAVQSGCTCSGGKVTISSGGYFYYRFRGPWPCLKNIELTAKLHIIAGSPVIEVSNDSMATWSTAVSTGNIGNNISKLYYMENSDHYADIYVRFRAPTGAQLEVEDVSFVAQRRTTGTTTPTIAAGSTRQIKISDGAGSTHSVTIEATFRERRRGV